MKTVTLTATNANGAASLTGKSTLHHGRRTGAGRGLLGPGGQIDRYQYAHFTDSSVTTPTKWEWSFGAGTTYTTTDYRV